MNALHSTPSPLSLLTPSPAEGQALASRLAQDLLASLPESADMAGHLRTGAFRPDRGTVTAIYFHAISLANAGWNQTVRR